MVFPTWPSLARCRAHKRQPPLCDSPSGSERVDYPAEPVRKPSFWELGGPIEEHGACPHRHHPEDKTDDRDDRDQYRSPRSLMHDDC